MREDGENSFQTHFTGFLSLEFIGTKKSGEVEENNCSYKHNIKIHMTRHHRPHRITNRFLSR